MEQKDISAGGSRVLDTREMESATELSELASNLQHNAETEKLLLARLLHDELGGALVGAKMDLAWLRRRVGSTAPVITSIADPTPQRACGAMPAAWVLCTW